MNLVKTNAIYACYPSVVTIRGVEAFDVDNNKINYDESVIQDYIDTNAYKGLRQAEYPTIGDQLDALWKGGDAATEMLALVQAVKNKYPKGTE